MDEASSHLKSTSPLTLYQLSLACSASSTTCEQVAHIQLLDFHLLSPPPASALLPSKLSEAQISRGTPIHHGNQIQTPHMILSTNHHLLPEPPLQLRSQAIHRDP